MTDFLLARQVQLLLARDSARSVLEDRLDHGRRREAGEVTSQMILIAVFATLAIAVGGIIYAKVTQTATNVPTDIGPATGGGPGGN